MKSKLMKLIKRDLMFGFENNKYKFMIICLVFMIVTWVNICYIKGQVFKLGISNDDINFIDLFFIMFKGADYNIFPLPINWILINIYVTYLIGSYCHDDLSEESSHMIVRIKNRKYFWISKVIWMIATIIVFYLILLSIIAFFSTIVFKMSFEWSEFSRDTIFNVMQINWSGIQFIFFTMFIYILTSITISIIQMFISFIIKPNYIYIINISILIISIFSSKFILPIQGSLVLRQNIFNSGYTISPISSVIYNLVVFTVVFVIGLKYIEKIDILVSQKND